MIPRFKRVSAVGRGSWMVWLDNPMEMVQVIKIVMNDIDQGTEVDWQAKYGIK